MKVVRGEEVKQEQGSTFTGVTRLMRLLGAQQPGGIALSLVHFEDGSRTHWHVGPGDVVYAAPMERHWHGAAAGHSMTHLSVTNVGPPEWFEAPD